MEALRYKQTLNIQSDYFYSQQKPNFKIRLSPTAENKCQYEHHNICVLYYLLQKHCQKLARSRMLLSEYTQSETWGKSIWERGFS